MKQTPSDSDQIVLYNGRLISKCRLTEQNEENGKARMQNYYTSQGQGPSNCYQNNVPEWAAALGWDPKTTTIHYTLPGDPAQTFNLADYFAAIGAKYEHAIETTPMGESALRTYLNTGT